MDKRLKLHNQLVEILGSKNVYYQPPESLKLKYPCIIYEKDAINQIYADDQAYLTHCRYSITHISQKPDSEVVDKLIKLHMCSFERTYRSDNLYHDLFNLYV